jgi:hypothetical protein
VCDRGGTSQRKAKNGTLLLDPGGHALLDKVENEVISSKEIIDQTRRMFTNDINLTEYRPLVHAKLEVLVG